MRAKWVYVWAKGEASLRAGGVSLDACCVTRDTSRKACLCCSERGCVFVVPTCPLEIMYTLSSFPPSFLLSFFRSSLDPPQTPHQHLVKPCIRGQARVARRSACVYPHQCCLFNGIFCNPRQDPLHPERKKRTERKKCISVCIYVWEQDGGDRKWPCNLLHVSCSYSASDGR